MSNETVTGPLSWQVCLCQGFYWAGNLGLAGVILTGPVISAGPRAEIRSHTPLCLTVIDSFASWPLRTCRTIPKPQTHIKVHNWNVAPVSNDSFFRCKIENVCKKLLPSRFWSRAMIGHWVEFLVKNKNSEFCHTASPTKLPTVSSSPGSWRVCHWQRHGTQCSCVFQLSQAL